MRVLRSASAQALRDSQPAVASLRAIPLNYPARNGLGTRDVKSSGAVMAQPICGPDTANASEPVVELSSMEPAAMTA